jgi:hypothetical protein
MGVTDEVTATKYIEPTVVLEAVVCRHHERVQQGDPSALNELAGELLQRLPRTVRLGYAFVPADVVADAIEDAILDYAKNPATFAATAGIPIYRLFQLAARRNLANTLRNDSRRRARELRYAELACHGHSSERCASASFAADDLLREALRLIPIPAERKAFREWFRGEQSTRRIAAVLGLAHLDPQTQRREVKRFKERIAKRLRNRFRGWDKTTSLPLT